MMTIRDEFLEILRVLAEVPEPSAKKPCAAEGKSSEGRSDGSYDHANEKSEGAGS
jgi:hypothetical protein